MERWQRPKSQPEVPLKPRSASHDTVRSIAAAADSGLMDSDFNEPSEDVSGQTKKDETENRLRELMGVALTAPTSEAIIEFSEFASRLHRLGPYNIYMVFAQRPGARAVASRVEWKRVGQTVRPDAIPILILRPKGPIMQVFELDDTLPQRKKDPRQDVFAALGEFRAETLNAMIKKAVFPQ